VIVEKTNVVRDGDMVVAITTEGDATLKHFYLEKNKVRLQPANPNYEPLYFPKGQVQVQGKVVQVLRQF
jgi:repressor LexA